MKSYHSIKLVMNMHLLHSHSEPLMHVYIHTSQKFTLSEMIKVTKDVPGSVDLFSSVASDDYNPVPAPAVLVFPTSASEGMPICANVSINDDMVLEGDHSFTVSISFTTPDVSQSSPSEADIVITDNDG